MSVVKGTNRERARRYYYDQNRKVPWIAKRLGISQGAVYRHLALGAYTQGQGPPLNRDSWLKWLQSMSKREQVPRGGNYRLLVNKCELSDQRHRMWTYWRQHSTKKVTLTAADNFCCHVDAPLPRYFLWCFLENREPWEKRPRSPETSCSQRDRFR